MPKVPGSVLDFPMPQVNDADLLMAAAIMDEQGRLFEPDFPALHDPDVIRINPEAWDRMIREARPSENIEDRREPLREGGMPFPRAE